MRKLSNFFDVSQLEMAPEAPGAKPKVKLSKEQVEAFKERKQVQKKQRLLARFVRALFVCLGGGR